MTAQQTFRLDGLEPDNLLAFLALLGCLRAVDKVQPAWRARLSWTTDQPPLRPRLHLAQAVSRQVLTEQIAQGVDALAKVHQFGGRPDLNFNKKDCRELLNQAASAASRADRLGADLMAALMHDAAIKDNKSDSIDPTPLCLLFGQGHQHFLERLAAVPRLGAPPARGRGKQAMPTSPEQSLGEALFETWQRQDPTPSFRWDPGEDVRYATMGGDPTDSAFKTGTQHGANRLAAVALPLFRLAAQARGQRVRPVIAAGRRDAEGFALAWPIWDLPVTLAGITGLLTHPALHTPRGLVHLGVVNVLVARRISVGKFMNFTRARPLESMQSAAPA